MLQNTYDTLDELLDQLESVSIKLYETDDVLPEGYELPLALKEKVREIFSEVLDQYAMIEKDHDKIVNELCEIHTQRWDP